MGLLLPADCCCWHRHAVGALAMHRRRMLAEHTPAQEGSACRSSHVRRVQCAPLARSCVLYVRGQVPFAEQCVSVPQRALPKREMVHVAHASTQRLLVPRCRMASTPTKPHGSATIRLVSTARAPPLNMRRSDRMVCHPRHPDPAYAVHREQKKRNPSFHPHSCSCRRIPRN